MLANEPEAPHPPISALPPNPPDGLGASGAFAGAGAGAAAAVVSGVLQALDPHTSELFQFPELMVPAAAAVGFVAGGDLAWFDERLKTELEAATGAGT